MKKSPPVSHWATRASLLALWFAQLPAFAAAEGKAAFSEDFESGKVDPAVWAQSVTGDNLIEVQREKVAHGNFALRVRCPAPATRP